MLRRLVSLVLVLLTAAAAGATAAGAQDLAGSHEARQREQLMRLKEAQRQAMLREPMEGREKRVERRREAQKRQAQARAEAKKQQKPGQRMKPITGDRLERLRQATLAERQRKAATAAQKSTTAALAPNRLVNNPFTDQWTSGQAEVSIAMDGNHVVAAWNDGEGFFTGGSTQGFGWSNDGGVTWRDGGAMKTGGGISYWASDPVVTVNEKTHKFYYAGLADFGSTNNGVGVVEGTFVGAADTLLWGTPMIAVSRPTASVLIDKEWIAADSTLNRLHIIFARFVISGGSIIANHIDYVLGTPSGGGWAFAAPTQLSSTFDAGYVQGARAIPGPAGEVYATWISIGKFGDQPGYSYYGRDWLRMRKSVNGGSSFAAQITADSVISNFGSGAPGFNRATGITFPGMAVDRTSGPNRGRVYLTWNESVNFYFDNLGTGPITRIESESNNTAGTADQFTVGDPIKGTLLASDVDWWKFNGNQGQTLVFYTDTVGVNLDLMTDVVCTDGNTQLSYNHSGTGGPPWAFTLHVFTLPATGTYYLRAQSWDGVSTGNYAVKTGWHTPGAGPLADRGRDHRDIFVKSSADGVSWPGTPKLVSLTPPWFDDFLPEVAVAGNGKPHVAWLDFHDAPAGVCLGGGANTYLSRSDDAGATWVPGSPVTDTTTVWSIVPSNIEPNMGDYIGLHTTPTNVVVSWADGRRGTPDIFMATVGTGFTGTTVSLANVQATPTEVIVTWQASDTNGLAVVVERRAPGEDWVAIGPITPDGVGRLVYTDTNVEKGLTYGYRLRITVDGGAPQVVGETSVFVPTGLALTLEGARPNPAPGSFFVHFVLADYQPAQLELWDVTGRRVNAMDVSAMGPGSHAVDLTRGASIKAGVYIIRLTQGGQTLTRRVAVVP
jgi:hypothetical protein